ncbi:putative uncharacterized protein [Roseburia sp. CAG:182]|nr:putative uncharacterized protein [Roseburia sp. CAG:182]
MKRAIYLSVLVVITVGCILWRVGSDAFGWFYSGDETEQGTEVSLEGTQVLDAFSEIRVESDVMDVTIQKGTDYSLSYRTAGKNKPAYSVKDGVLSVTQKQQKKHWNLGMVSNKSAAMTITVPEDVALKDVDITSNVGDVKIDKVKAKNLDVTADVGDIEAALVGESDAYDISFDCGVGEATLNGENVKKNTQIHAADAEGKIELSADVGDIDVSIE